MVLLRRLAEPGYGFRVVLRNAFSVIVADAKIVLRGGIALLRRLAVPGYGFRVVLLHAESVLMAPAETVLRVGVALLRRLAVPGYGFGIVLRNALSIIVAFTEVDHDTRIGRTKFRRLANELEAPLRIGRDARAVLEKQPEIVHRNAVAAFDGLLVPIHRQGDVLRKSVASGLQFPGKIPLRRGGRGGILGRRLRIPVLRDRADRRGDTVHGCGLRRSGLSAGTRGHGRGRTDAGECDGSRQDGKQQDDGKNGEFFHGRFVGRKEVLHEIRTSKETGGVRPAAPAQGTGAQSETVTT